jgi:hypothetical protein
MLTHNLNGLNKGSAIMKKFAFILYTIICLALGGLIFQGITQASSYCVGQYYKTYPLGAPKGYKETFGVSFINGVNRGQVIVDWKSSENFVVYIK